MDLFEPPKTKAGRYVESTIRLGLGLAGFAFIIKGNPAGNVAKEVAVQAGAMAGQATDLAVDMIGAGLIAISNLWSLKNVFSTVKIPK